MVCNVWQSHVDIEHYIVTQFNCVTTFEVLLHALSVGLVHAAKVHEYLISIHRGEREEWGTGRDVT